VLSAELEKAPRGGDGGTSKRPAGGTIGKREALKAAGISTNRYEKIAALSLSTWSKTRTEEGLIVAPGRSCAVLAHL
jgi:hypothetical protein